MVLPYDRDFVTMSMSSKKCCVPNCDTTRADNTTMHLFPNPDKDLNRFDTWKNAIGGHIVTMESCNIFELRRVCHLHFEPRYHTHSKRLSPNAVPTLHLTGLFVSTRQPMQDITIYKDCNKLVKETRTYYNENDTIQMMCYNYFKKHEKIKNRKMTVFLFHPNHCNDQENVTKLPDDPFPTDIVEFDAYIPMASPPPEEQLETTEEDCIPVNGPFTWQNQSEAVPVAAEEAEAEVIDIPDNLSMYCDDETKAPITANDNVGDKYESRHEGYQCNTCSNDIVGYRYTCVQCADYDLCGACEASGAHPHHYALRVPGARAQKEIQEVLESIRSSLNVYMSAVATCCDTDQISVKSETKEEPPEPDDINKLLDDVLDESLDHSKVVEPVMHSETEEPGSEHDDDPLSMHYKEIEYLEEDIPPPSPCDKESSTIENWYTNDEIIKIPDVKVLNEPSCVESKLKRKIIIDKSELMRVKQIASILPNKRIRLVVQRKNKDTTWPDKSNEGCKHPELFVGDSIPIFPESFINNEKAVPSSTVKNDDHNVFAHSVSQAASSDPKAVRKYGSALGRKTKNSSEPEKQIRLLAIKSTSTDGCLAPRTDIDSDKTYYIPEKTVNPPLNTCINSDVSNSERRKRDFSYDHRSQNLSQINLIKSIMNSNVSVRVQPLSEKQIMSFSGDR